MSAWLGVLLVFVGLAPGSALGWWLARRIFKQRLERALAAARTDPLTGLDNRRSFDEHLALFSRIARRYGSPLTLVLFDIDCLKAINDRFGHAAGDAALVHFARIARISVRESDVVARIGGDEFALLLPQTDKLGAETLAARIRENLSKTACEWAQGAPSENRGEPGSPGFTILASAGIAQFEADAGPTGLLERADKSLYAAKFAQERNEPPHPSPLGQSSNRE